MDFIVARIVELLKERNMQSKELARKLGVNASAISEWKKGKLKPSIETLISISRIFNISLEWLLTGTENTTNSVPQDLVQVAIKEVTPQLPVDELNLLDIYRKLSNPNKSLIHKTAVDLFLTDKPTAENKLLNFPAKSQTLKPVAPLDEELEEPNEQIEMKVFDLPASAGFGNYLDGDIPYDMLTFDAYLIPYSADFGIRISGDSMQPLINDEDIVWVKEQVQIDNGNIGIFILDGDAYCKKLDIDYAERKMRLLSLNQNYSPIVVNKNHDFRTVGKVLL